MIVIVNDMKGYVYLVVILLCVTAKSAAQSDTIMVTDTSAVVPVFVQNTNSQRVDASTDTLVQYLLGDVRLYYDSAFFFCDTAVLIEDYAFKGYGNVSMMKTDSLRIFCDSLIYYLDSGMAYFYGEKDGNVVLQNGETELYTNYMIYDADRELAMYTNRGLLITPNSKVKSRRGYFHVKDKYANFYDDVSVEGDDFDILTDSLRYYDWNGRAEFLAPVVVTQGERRIFSESGYFDIDDDIGEFVGSAQVIEKTDTSTADKIVYDGLAGLTSLLGNARYRSEQESGEADSIYYNKQEETVRLMGQAVFRDATNEVAGDAIVYDQVSESMEVEGRSLLSNPPFLVEARDLNYQKDIGVATADGDVIWQDTSSDYTIYADHIRYREEGSHMKAYNDVGKPLLESIITAGDTMYLSGDTLIAFEEQYYQEQLAPEPILMDTLAGADSLAVAGDTVSVTEGTTSQELMLDSLSGLPRGFPVTDTLALALDSALILDSLVESNTMTVDTQRVFVSYPRVEILMSDVQAVCDSFTYLEKQSRFILCDDPIMWADSSQFSGDTIIIHQGEAAIEKVELKVDAVLLSTDDMIYFNQIAGQKADIYFTNKKVRRLDVNKDATSVYYLIDDEDAYIGANQSSCRRIVFTFANGEPDKTRFYDENSHTLTPMDRVNHEAIKVKGYNWDVTRQPKELNDLKD